MEKMKRKLVALEIDLRRIANDLKATGEKEDGEKGILLLMFAELVRGWVEKEGTAELKLCDVPCPQCDFGLVDNPKRKCSVCGYRLTVEDELKAQTGGE